MCLLPESAGKCDRPDPEAEGLQQDDHGLFEGHQRLQEPGLPGTLCEVRWHNRVRQLLPTVHLQPLRPPQRGLLRQVSTMLKL